MTVNTDDRVECDAKDASECTSNGDNHGVDGCVKYNCYGCDDSEGDTRLHVHGDGCGWS